MVTHHLPRELQRAIENESDGLFVSDHLDRMAARAWFADVQRDPRDAADSAADSMFTIDRESE